MRPRMSTRFPNEEGARARGAWGPLAAPTAARPLVGVEEQLTEQLRRVDRERDLAGAANLREVEHIHARRDAHREPAREEVLHAGLDGDVEIERRVRGRRRRDGRRLGDVEPDAAAELEAGRGALDG